MSVRSDNLEQPTAAELADISPELLLLLNLPLLELRGTLERFASSTRDRREAEQRANVSRLVATWVPDSDDDEVQP